MLVFKRRDGLSVFRACLAGYEKETFWYFDLKPLRQMVTFIQNGRQAGG